jgi:23S rRNA (pseudouridine1915-N3)-methyltransferase
MKIQIWSVGKVHESYVRPGVEEFSKRINKYFPLEWVIIPPPRNSNVLNEKESRQKEGELIIERLKKDDLLVALDEHGKPLSSAGLAEFINAKAQTVKRNLIFLIGGAYGLDEQVLRNADFCWSLSALTFPHQLVRLILSEQLYRACTILRNEKYHHA